MIYFVVDLGMTLIYHTGRKHRHGDVYGNSFKFNRLHSGKELPVKYAVKWTRSIDFKCECILWEGMTYNGYFGNLENEFLNKYKQNL
jgi:hypothetical protein